MFISESASTYVAMGKSKEKKRKGETIRSIPQHVLPSTRPLETLLDLSLGLLELVELNVFAHGRGVCSVFPMERSKKVGLGRSGVSERLRAWAGGGVFLQSCSTKCAVDVERLVA